MLVDTFYSVIIVQAIVSNAHIEVNMYGEMPLGIRWCKHREDRGSLSGLSRMSETGTRANWHAAWQAKMAPLLSLPHTLMCMGMVRQDGVAMTNYI